MKEWKGNEFQIPYRVVTKRPMSNYENMKRPFQMSWSQRGHDIYIIFTRKSSLFDFSLFDVALTDRACIVRGPDSEKHGWNFFMEVNAKEAQRIQSGDRLIITVPKKDPTLYWSNLKKSTEMLAEAKEIKLSSIACDEPPPEKIRHQSKDLYEDIQGNLSSEMVKEMDEEYDYAEVDTKNTSSAENSTDPAHTTLYHHLTSVKSNWQELGSDIIVFTVFVPHLDPWGANASFTEDRIQICFKTVDETFHKEYGTTPDVMFVWNVNLNKKVIPAKCSHKVALNLIEIRLYKKDPVKWNGIIHPNPKSDEAKESDDSSNEDHLSSGDNLSLPEDNSIGSPSITRRKTKNTSSASSADSNRSSWNKPSTSRSMKPLTPRSGYTGLDNIGNTCFMNSVVQALANTRELRDFFLQNRYKADLNTTNPLGMRGKMAEGMADIMKKLWMDTPISFAPIKFRRVVGEEEARFVNYLQHDAQEFMAFLLDKLHEDLNRIKDKPCYEMPEVGDRDDRVVAEESWKLHTSRNDSFIVDLFYGMFKSKLYCPVCETNSVKFDPFLFLSVPLPKITRSIHVCFFPGDVNCPPVKVSINVSKKYGKANEIFNQVSSMFKCRVNSLRMYEVFKNRIHRFFVPDSSLEKIGSNDVIIMQETTINEEQNEPVYELAVQQQERTFPELSPCCSYCKNNSSDVKIKRCTKCLRTGYCNQECQKADWPQHRKVCQRTPDLVGYPFLVSVPQSKATCSYVKKLLWQQAKRCTNVQCCNVATDTNDDVNPDIGSLFYVVAMNWNGSVKSDLPNLEDFGDDLLDLSHYKLVSLRWETDNRLSRYVKVSTKQLDFSIRNSSSSSDRVDLHNCIRLFTEPEVLDPLEAWYCPTCREHREATKEMSLWQLPDILIVQLKRFSFKNLLWRDKIDMFVDFPVDGLDMSQYCVNTSDGSPLIYDLFAVVNHYGGIFGGHYTSFVRLPNPDDTTKSTIGWRVCDDSHVTKMSAEHVVTKAAYVMFYKKRNVCEPRSEQSNTESIANKIEEDPDKDSVSSPGYVTPALSCSGESLYAFNRAQNVNKDQDNPSSMLCGNNFNEEDSCDLNEKMAKEVRLSTSEGVMSSPPTSYGVRLSQSSPELMKGISPFSNQVSMDDCNTNQGMNMSCISHGPLLKYDEVFAADALLCDDKPATSSTSVPMSNEANEDVYIEPPYTDMDAVD